MVGFKNKHFAFYGAISGGPSSIFPPCEFVIFTQMAIPIPSIVGASAFMNDEIFSMNKSSTIRLMWPVRFIFSEENVSELDIFDLSSQVTQVILY